MKRLTQEEFEERVNNIYHGKFRVIGEYINRDIEINVQCNDCDFIISNYPKRFYSGKVFCPICEPQKMKNIFIRGVNDMWTTNPEIAQLLKDPNDGYKYTINSDVKLCFICPNCSHEIYMYPRNVKNRGLHCNYCADNLSYPNKFIRSLLKLLNISFQLEYKIGNTSYFYDAFFVYKNHKYLIEMDGGYGHGCVDTKHYTIQEQLEIDKAKDDLAHQNNYKIIRIDCKYHDIEKRKQYVIDGIKKSLLNKLFVLTDDLFEEANRLSQKSILVDFKELWDSGQRMYETYKNELNVQSNSTIRHYARRCIEIGLIDCTYDEFKQQMKTIYSNLPHRMNPVMCNETGICYASYGDVKRQLNIGNLHSYFSRNWSYCGILPDGTKLTWKQITKEEYLEYVKSNN